MYRGHGMVVSLGLGLLLLVGCHSDASLHRVFRADDPSRNDGPLAGGTAVKVKGSHFGSDTKVLFDGIPIVNPKVKGSGLILGETPPGKRAGPVRVEIRGRNGSDRKEAGWIYNPESISITDVTPDLGHTDGGTFVTITGTGFVKGTVIEFETSPPALLQNMTIVDSNTITGETPPSSPPDTEQTVDVTVTNGWGSDTLEGGFEYKTCINPVNPVNIVSIQPAVHDLEVDLTTPDRIYAAADDVTDRSGGVWRSDDGGISWAEMSNGLETAGAEAEMRSLAIDPNSGNNLFGGALGRLCRSTDGALTWVTSDDGISNSHVRSLVRSATGSTYAGTFGAGVFRSDDDGRTWAAVNGTPPASLTATRVKAVTLAELSGTLCAGTSDGGVFMSNDSGMTWSEENWGLYATIDPFKSTHITAVAVTPEAENEVYIGTEGGGVFRTDEGGTAGLLWYGVPGDPLLGLIREDRIRSLVVSERIERFRDPSVDPLMQFPFPIQVVVAGTNGGGLFASTDGGASWQDYSMGLPHDDVRSVFVGVERIVDPVFPLRFADNFFIYAGTHGGGIARGRVTIRIEADPFNPSQFKAFLRWITWTTVNSGLGNTVVTAIAVDPNRLSNVFAGTEGSGVYATGDGGASWEPLDPGGSISSPYVNDLGLVFDSCTKCTTILAGTDGGGANRIRMLKQ